MIDSPQPDETRAGDAPAGRTIRERALAGARGRTAAPAPLEVRVVSTAEGLESLAPAWSALHAAHGRSVFASYEWQRAWWRHFGEGVRNRTLHVVVVAAGDRVIAIAPLFVETVRVLALAKLRRLAFLGTGLTDYLDVLAEAGREAECYAEIASHLASRPVAFDVVSLVDIPDGSPTHQGLHGALERCGFEGARFVVEYCPRTHLKESWSATLASFEGSRRRQLSKRVRQLKEGFAVELEICPGGDALDADVDAFMQLHQHRWTSVGKKGVYAEQKAAAFQREVAQAFSARGWLFLAFLRLDGARRVGLCGFTFRDELGYYLNGMGELGEARKFSPGLVMHALCMEELIGRGVRVYDFLRGTERYKYECGAVDVPSWGILAFRRGARLAPAKNRAVLLRESLGRRLEAERLAFAHQRSTYGLFSRQTLSHVGRVLWTTLRDGLRKLRAPEKSLTVDA